MEYVQDKKIVQLGFPCETYTEFEIRGWGWILSTFVYLSISLSALFMQLYFWFIVSFGSNLNLVFGFGPWWKNCVCSRVNMISWTIVYIRFYITNNYPYLVPLLENCMEIDPVQFLLDCFCCTIRRWMCDIPPFQNQWKLLSWSLYSKSETPQ